MDHLLTIIKRDRAWNDGAAKTLLFKAFDSLGAGDDRMKKARRRLSNILLM
jgi:putative thioredoxin